MNISVNELYTAHANECLSLHNPRRMQCEKGLCRGDIFRRDLDGVGVAGRDRARLSCEIELREEIEIRGEMR